MRPVQLQVIVRLDMVVEKHVWVVPIVSVCHLVVLMLIVRIAFTVTVASVLCLVRMTSNVHKVRLVQKVSVPRLAPKTMIVLLLRFVSLAFAPFLPPAVSKDLAMLELVILDWAVDVAVKPSALVTAPCCCSACSSS